MRILVLGAGGVGGFFGGHLAKAGADVIFLVREQRAAQLRRSGLVIDSPLGNFNTPVEVATLATEVHKPDIIVLACKAYDLPKALDAIRPAVESDVVILPLLNGLAHLDEIREKFEAVTVWGGLVHLGVTLTDAGVIRHLNNLSILHFGPLNGGVDQRAEYVAKLFASTPVQAVVCPQVEQEMWDKFVFLTTLAGMTCLMRAHVGAIVAADKGERLTLQLFDECCAVAKASGFPPSGAQLTSYRAHLTQQGSSSKASMLRDMERGGPTEGEHVLGDMAARARHFAIDAPLLEIALTNLRIYESLRASTP